MLDHLQTRLWHFSPRVHREGTTTLHMPLTHSLTHSEYHPNTGLRNIVIGVAVVLVALFLLSFAVRITRI